MFGEVLEMRSTAGPSNGLRKSAKQNRYTQILLPLMEKYDLIPAFDIDPNFDSQTSYTRNDAKTQSYSLIDGILISKNLESKVTRIAICHDALNVSDHAMVETDMVLDVLASQSGEDEVAAICKLEKIVS